MWSPVQVQSRSNSCYYNFLIDMKVVRLLAGSGVEVALADMESVHYFNDHSGSVSPHA